MTEPDTTARRAGSAERPVIPVVVRTARRRLPCDGCRHACGGWIERGERYEDHRLPPMRCGDAGNTRWLQQRVHHPSAGCAAGGALPDALAHRDVGGGAALAVLIGPAGSGKSTLAAAGWEPGQVVSLDELRGRVSGDPCNQDATAAAVAVMCLLLRERLRRRLATVVDATNAETPDRALLLGIARECQVPAVAVVLGTPLEVCLSRNATRPGLAPGARWGQRVPEAVIRRQHEHIQAALPGLPAEGFTAVVTL